MLIQIPIFDGSAKEWVEAVEEVGLKVATDIDGKSCDKIAPHVKEPVYVWRDDSFVAAFPSEVVQITYGISFPQVMIDGHVEWRILPYPFKTFLCIFCFLLRTILTGWLIMKQKDCVPWI